MFGASPPNCREDSFRIGQRQHQIHGATGTSLRETVLFPKAPPRHGLTRAVPPLRSQGLVADPALRTGHADAVAANVPAANRARVTGRLGCRSSWRHDEGWQRVTWRAAVNHENGHKGLLALHDRDDASRLPAGLMPRLPRILFRLQEATHPGSADAPGFRLHPLKDGRARLWFPRSYTNRSNSSAQQRPKGTVEVSCEPASVAQDDPGVCITNAVLSYGRRCLVVYLNPAN